MRQDGTIVNCIYKSLFSGNITDISLEGCVASEIRSDIVLKKYDDIQIWGYIRNSKGFIVENALVELHKVLHSGEKETYCCLTQTLSDCNGFYQINLSMAQCNTCYKIIVEKYNISSEYIMGNNIKCGAAQWFSVPLINFFPV